MERRSPDHTSWPGTRAADGGLSPITFGWLANCWTFLTGGLEGLPLAKLIVPGCAVAVFAAEFGRLLRSPSMPNFVIPPVLLQTKTHDSSRWLLTESPFVAFTLLACPVIRRRAPPVTVLVWGIAIVLPGSLVVTSAVEMGHLRYAVAHHVPGIAMLLWLLVQLLPGLMRPGLGRTGNPLP